MPKIVVAEIEIAPSVDADTFSTDRPADPGWACRGSCPSEDR
jgi:hypothetical protein